LFVPVSDADNLEKLVKRFFADLKVEEEKWFLTVQGMSLYGTVSEDYLFLSNAQDALEDLAEPEKITSGDQDLAIELNLASIPKEIKQTFLAAFEQGARQKMAEGPKPDSEAEARGQQIGAEWVLSVIKSVTNDGDRLKFGVNVDTESGLATVDLGLTGAPKTALASAMATYGKTVPAFAAVPSDDAALQMIVSHPTTGIVDKMDDLFAAIRKTTDSTIDQDPTLKDDADRKAAKDVASRLFSIVKATIKSGTLHSVLVLEKGAGDTARIVGGTKVAKGDDAAKLWDDVLKLSKESPELAKVKTDAAKHAGARIHAIAPDLNDKQTALFGEDPMHLAIRADSLWLSMGGGNLDALKKELDSSGKKGSKSVAPISINMKPATLVTIMEKEDKGLIQRAEAIAGESGDVLNFSVTPTEGTGIDLHLEFGIGLFGLAGPN